MNDERWIVACHEAGHAVVALVLGGRCDGLALSADGEGGLAQCCELLGDRVAYVDAAGNAAEYLAKRNDAPELPIQRSQVAVDEITAELPMVLVMASERPVGHLRRYVSDERSIALWAIAGHEGNPESWAGRVARVHRTASEIVERNADQILAVARALYVAGKLNGDEIKSLYEGSKCPT